MITFNPIDKIQYTYTSKRKVGLQNTSFLGTFGCNYASTISAPKRISSVVILAPFCKKLGQLLKISQPKANPVRNFSEEILYLRKKWQQFRIKRTSRERSITILGSNAKPVYKTYYDKNKCPIRAEKFDATGKIIEIIKYA